MTRLFLVDDHRILREALRSLLEKHPDLEVLGEAGDGPSALDTIAGLMQQGCLPDIVCMDIGLPGQSGISVTRQLIDRYPGLRVIALSSYIDPVYVRDMIHAGASAYVAKGEGGADLLQAIEAVMQGQTYFSAGLDPASRVSSPPVPGTSAATIPLGAREVQVLRLVAAGLTSPQIAENLKIAPATVEVHRRNIMRKLGLHRAVDLTRYAITHGLAES